MGKIKKRFSAILTLVVFMFNGIVPTTVFAETTNHTIHIKEHDITYLYGPLGNHPPVRMVDYLVDENGKEVFCINFEKESPDGLKYSRGEELSSSITYLTKQFYNGNPLLTGDRKLDYYIVQAAIHSLEPNNFRVFSYDGKTYDDPKGIIPKIEALVAQAKKAPKEETPVFNNKLSVNNTNPNMMLKGDKYESDLVTVSIEGTTKNTNISLENATSNSYLANENGEKITTVSNGTKFKIVTPVNELNGREINPKVNIKAEFSNAYTVAMRYFGDGSKQDIAHFENKQFNESKDISVTTSIKEVRGGVKFIKKGSDGKLLDGVTFQIQDENGKVQAQAKTVNGHLEFNNLSFGTHYLVETKTIEGYLLNGTKKPFTISQNNQVIDLGEVTNNIIKGKIKIVKKDAETGNTLQGAEFQVINKESGKVVQTVTTGADGTATTADLNYGQYIIKEVKAPNKYILNGQAKIATINENGKTVDITQTDRIIKGKVSVKKTDSEMKNLNLSGAEFTIYDNNGKAVQTITTNNDGYAISGALLFGDYTMKETKAPVGYLSNDKVWNISVTEDAHIYNFDVQDKVIKGKIQIVKINSDTKEKLGGAKFGVYSKNVSGVKADTLIDTITSNSDGFAFTKDLRFGEYYIKELKAPKGFIKNDETQSVSITQNGKTLVEYIKNTPIRARISIIKLDGENKKPIANTQFKFVNTDNGKDVGFISFEGTKAMKQIVFTTNENGEIFTPQPLAYGHYKLVEVQAATGYVLGQEIPFVIDENTNIKDIQLLGPVFTMDVTNQRITGAMELQKVDSTTGKSLPDATFEITCTKGFQKGKTWTATSNEEGKIDISNLQYGDFVLKETKAPTGYVLNETPMSFQVRENGKVIKLTMKDKPVTNEIDFTKTDVSTGKVIDGAKIKITCTEGLEKGKVVEFTSAKEGNKFTLKYGKYTFEETKPAPGYNNTTEKGTFEITKEGVVQKANLNNTPITGQYDFSKTDVTNGQIVAGAKIKITCTEGLEKGKVIEFTSAKEGNKFTLKYGKYDLVEVAAPVGYNVNTATTKFEITKQGEVIKGNIKDSRITAPVHFTKTDVTTSKEVAGAKIKITCTEGFEKGKVIEFTTTEKGNDFTLEFGKYQFEEVTAPIGYNLNKAVGIFEIKEDGKIIKADIKDTPITSTVELTKTDVTTSKEVPGAKIQITCVEGLDKGKVIDFTSKDTATKFDLKYGKYEFKEITAPAGYNLNSEIGTFEVTKQGEVIKCNIKDSRTTGKLIISKIDITNGKEIEGAKIKITCTEGLDKGKVIEFTSKKTATEFELTAGTYEYVETTAPKGYEINKTVGTFKITKQGEIVKCTVKDKPIKQILPKTGEKSQTPFLVFGIMILALGMMIEVSRRISNK